MPVSQLPLDAFPAWALLNNVRLDNVKLQETDSMGFGVVVEQDASGNEDDGQPGGQHRDALIRIPRDLILCSETVEDYAKVDQDFRQLLDVLAWETTRQKVMIYLLVHLVLPTRTQELVRGGASTPWTEYIKFLPRPIPTPVMWSETERDLLSGTSLEFPVHAKLNSLTGEFEHLQAKSSTLPFWNTLFWESVLPILEYWTLVDAWFRSRSLELPRRGEAMVPALDMVNHSAHANAYYDENDAEDVVLALRPGTKASKGDEITISYGEAKSAAEMLFSYGFVDDTARREMTLFLPLPDDDPLAKAKLHTCGGPPTVRLSQDSDGTFRWESRFAYLLFINEEDGLQFRMLQDKDGGRQLRLFWQDQDVTERADDFETLVQGHALAKVFKLRVVMAMSEVVSAQLEEINSEVLRELLLTDESGECRPACVAAAASLREFEKKILEGCAEVLDAEESRLIQDDGVLAYLTSLNNETEYLSDDDSESYTHSDADEFS